MLQPRQRVQTGVKHRWNNYTEKLTAPRFSEVLWGEWFWWGVYPLDILNQILLDESQDDGKKPVSWDAKFGLNKTA